MPNIYTNQRRHGRSSWRYSINSWGVLLLSVSASCFHWGDFLLYLPENTLARKHQRSWEKFLVLQIVSRHGRTNSPQAHLFFWETYWVFSSCKSTSVLAKAVWLLLLTTKPLCGSKITVLQLSGQVANCPFLPLKTESPHTEGGSVLNIRLPQASCSNSSVHTDASHGWLHYLNVGP